MHIGNLRTALYEYLIAKSHGGRFVLRIEDTDQERFVEGAVELIYQTLKTAGLAHDEGPDVGGDYGPYVQSERKLGYMEYAKELVDRGAAYYCFCTRERLAGLREENERAGRTNFYDRRCLALSNAEVRQNLDANKPFVIRQKMPSGGSTVFHDAVYGEITVDNSELEDQVLIKSDGMPTYNFANVVDDHLMAITHVVRGSEYLSSTPKYNLLYEAFGWDIPVYVHLPTIVKEGGQKFSKRAGDPSFVDLLEMGYLPEALVNYIALLGWAPRDNQEFFSVAELAGVFSIEGISKSPSTFDYAKLNYFNAEYLRRKSPEEFHALALPYIQKAVRDPRLDTFKISRTLQQRTETLRDIPGMIDFFDALPVFTAELYTHKKMKTDPDVAKNALSLALPVLRGLELWSPEPLHAALVGLAEQNGFKNSQVLWPLRVALSGKPVTPGGAVEIADILGKDESLRRVEAALAAL
jgi:glutamyl-tRNA synthetase